MHVLGSFLSLVAYPSDHKHKLTRAEKKVVVKMEKKQIGREKNLKVGSFLVFSQKQKMKFLTIVIEKKRASALVLSPYLQTMKTMRLL